MGARGFALLLLLGAGAAMAVEEAQYTVVAAEGDCQLRDYAACVVAEVVVQAGVEEAGNQAFRPLFRYISGENRARGKIAMTAPVGQEQTPAGYAVSFMMPASYTLETLPEPTDPAVRLRAVPARRMAAIRYSGTWSASGYEKHRRQLEQWMAARGLEAAGEAVWARYDPPFMPWFLRRNEVLIPVASTP